MNLLKDLQEEFGLTFLFIAHDLAVVEFFCDVVAVMYMGKIVERATAGELYQNPLHPYTRALMSAIPQVDPSQRGRRGAFGGEVPSVLNPPGGCAFGPRCSLAEGVCLRQIPALKEGPRFAGTQRSGYEGHFAACWKC